MKTQLELQEELRGSIQRVTYLSDRSGFAVFSVIPDGGVETVTVKGCCHAAAPGVYVECSGGWVNDPRWGRQFDARSIVPLTPRTPDGMREFLAARIDGIGEVMAGRLVDAFGADALETILSRPERVAQVPGVGLKRAQALRDAAALIQANVKALTFLMGLGVTAGAAQRIANRYGDSTELVVRRDPYVLAFEVEGIGFKRADEIAARLGISGVHAVRVRGLLYYVLTEAAFRGHTHLSLEEWRAECGRLQEVFEEEVFRVGVESLLSAARVVRGEVNGREVYFPAALFGAERRGADRLLWAYRTAGDPLADAERLEDMVRRYESENHIQLEALQREAILGALTSRISVITGGPGTGKTTIVRGICSAISALGRIVLLCSPTGRAAKRLSEASGMRASTIHRLLGSDGKGGFKHNAETPLICDMLVIDEASMLDVSLFKCLLDALPSASRLVLVGDTDQLPSVGPGKVLNDVIASGIARVTRLEHIFRQAQQSLIVTNAHRINRGAFPVSAKRGESPPGDFYILRCDDQNDAPGVIVDLLTEHIPTTFGFDPFRDVQVLTPMRKGGAGVEALNLALQDALNPGPPLLERKNFSLRAGDKVMQTKNDYGLDVFNGESGRVVGYDAVNKELTVDFDGKTVCFPSDKVAGLVLSYAVTIHKSQGSEYPAVIIPLFGAHHVMLQRNLLYTAVTRGRRLVVLVGENSAIGSAVSNDTVPHRNSALRYFLEQGRKAPESPPPH